MYFIFFSSFAYFTSIITSFYLLHYIEGGLFIYYKIIVDLLFYCFLFIEDRRSSPRQRSGRGRRAMRARASGETARNGRRPRRCIKQLVARNVATVSQSFANRGAKRARLHEAPRRHASALFRRPLVGQDMGTAANVWGAARRGGGALHRMAPCI